jgi:hypothetical protein
MVNLMIEQGTIEWRMLRLGKISGSRISDVMAKGRDNKPSVTRENYMYELATERLTNIPTESYTSPAMSWGTENEGMARTAYEVFKSVFVSEVPWIPHPSIANAGCSPDGLIDDGIGCVELKCPNTKTHIEYILKGEPAKTYHNQMMWQMACTGRSYVDFVSYDPRLPVDLELFVARLERDEEYIQLLTDEVIKFDNEVTQLVNKLKEIRNV